MKLAIGYQEPENGEKFSAIVQDYQQALEEVYYSWPGQASGRAADLEPAYLEQARENLLDELQKIRALGIKLDLLFNANCYGSKAIAAEFEKEIIAFIEYLAKYGLLPEIVTTTSIFVAQVVKKHFPGIELRASVNMRIDSTLAMHYVRDWFDSFYLRRDLQRDLDQVAEFHQWCQANDKKLCLLANSGCLRNCPAQTFHDNLVAHENELWNHSIAEGYDALLCWRLFAKPENMVEFLRGSWIRPEDLFRYRPYIQVVKLATRRHSHPRTVIGAYASGSYSGNLANLTEPGFALPFAPYSISNELFPPDWYKIAAACASNCHHCGKCDEVLKQVLVKQ